MQCVASTIPLQFMSTAIKKYIGQYLQLPQIDPGVWHCSDAIVIQHQLTQPVTAAQDFQPHFSQPEEGQKTQQ